MSVLDCASKLNLVKSGNSEKPSQFREATLQFIRDCEKQPFGSYDIRSTSERLGFKQRRFYDVVNVFETIGCCPKIDNDSFIWIGFSETKDSIERMCKEKKVFDRHKTLDEIFNYPGCISVQKITEELLLLFIALETRKINIIDVSYYLSRKNDREKTTRCKLYQVAVILELAGIIRKTEKISEFEINEKYFIEASKRFNNDPDPTSIFNLLSRLSPHYCDQCIRSRRYEFAEVQKEYSIV